MQLGHLDHASGSVVSGWATSSNAPTRIVVAVDGEFIAIVTPNVYRSDLLDHGIAPQSGFLLELEKSLYEGQVVSAIFPDGTHLAGSPISVEVALIEPSLEDTRQQSLIFLHIPKTAGTSLRRAIDHAAPGRVSIYNREFEDLVWVREFRTRKAPPIIIGHFSYGAHDLLDLKPRYATVLRQPLQRLISLHRHINFLPECSNMHHKRQSLAEMILSLSTEQTNNHMCRIIAGIRVDQGIVINDNWLLELALHNISKNFAFVGNTENLPFLLSLISQELKLELPSLEVENVSRGPLYEVTDDDMDAFSKYNALDVLLYNNLFSDAI